MMHSKGPWTATIHDSVAVVTDGDGYAVAHVERGDDRPALPRLRAEYESNARLIAAAPALLEACEAAYDAMLREDFGTVTLAPQLRAAIAKARRDDATL